MVAVCMAFFITIVSVRWPDGAEVLSTIFSFANPSMSVSALDCLTFELMNSESIFDSLFESFKGLKYDCK